MRGMIQRRQRLDSQAGGPLVLFYGGRTPEELPYLDELRALSPDFIDLHLAYSRVNGHARTYVQDALREQREQVARLILKDRCCVYLCGLQGMERGVHDALTDILRSAGADWNALLPQLNADGRYHLEVY
jgi:benzoyl-CoA 2,3-dioxygenase component A